MGDDRDDSKDAELACLKRDEIERYCINLILYMLLVLGPFPTRRRYVNLLNSSKGQDRLYWHFLSCFIHGMSHGEECDAGNTCIQGEYKKYPRDFCWYFASACNIFAWKFMQLLNNKIYTLPPRRWQNYAVSTKTHSFLSIPSFVFPGNLQTSKTGKTRTGYCRCSKPRIAVKRLMDSHCFVDAFLQLSLPSLRGR